MPADTYNDQNQLILSLLCITALVASAVMYAKMGTSHGYLDDKNSTELANDLNANDSSNKEELVKNITKPKMVMKIHPSCPPQDKHLELTHLCKDFIFARFSCKPEDVSDPVKHKIPKYYYENSLKNNSNNNDTQTTLVNYIIALVLLTSLGAALLEFYRAKINPSPEQEKKGAKAPLNRKCSLADLTVLKHHRKELVRRESILEPHLEQIGESQDHHQDINSPPPLHRRCSFPATLPSSNYPSLMSGGGDFSGSRRSRRTARKLSMVGGDLSRRLSTVVTDEQSWFTDVVLVEEDLLDQSRIVPRH